MYSGSGSDSGKPDLNSHLAAHPGIEIKPQPTSMLSRLRAGMEDAVNKVGVAATKVGRLVETLRGEPRDSEPIDKGWVKVPSQGPRLGNKFVRRSSCESPGIRPTPSSADKSAKDTAPPQTHPLSRFPGQASSEDNDPEEKCRRRAPHVLHALTLG